MRLSKELSLTRKLAENGNVSLTVTTHVDFKTNLTLHKHSPVIKHY